MDVINRYLHRPPRGVYLVGGTPSSTGREKGR